MPRVAFKERCAWPDLIWLGEQAISRHAEIPRDFFHEAVRKPQDERLDFCRRSDLDRIRLAVVKDQVTAVID